MEEMKMHPFRAQRAEEHRRYMLTANSVYSYLKRQKDCLGNFKEVKCKDQSCLRPMDKLAAAYNKIAEKKCNMELL